MFRCWKLSLFNVFIIFSLCVVISKTIKHYYQVTPTAKFNGNLSLAVLTLINWWIAVVSWLNYLILANDHWASNWWSAPLTHLTTLPMSFVEIFLYICLYIYIYTWRKKIFNKATYFFNYLFNMTTFFQLFS